MAGGQMERFPMKIQYSEGIQDFSIPRRGHELSLGCKNGGYPHYTYKFTREVRLT